MADIALSSVVNVCEDTNKTFSLIDILAQAGYVVDEPITVLGIFLDDEGNLEPAPTPLVRDAGDNNIEITAGNVANYNGSFTTMTFIIDNGANFITLTLQVVIDPVNDAPSGADSTVQLTDGSPYVLSQSNFGFSDAVEGDAMKSVVINTLPIAGTLLLDGVALVAGAEVSAADIAAGKLTFAPPTGSTGLVQFAFQVRDTGGTAGCNASDLDATPNHLSFQIPLTASIGDKVWNDANGNGLLDGTEAGIAGVSVTLQGAGADGTFGTADDTTTSTTTNAQGNYLFDQLAAGKYRVQADGLAGYTFTTKDAGGNTNEATDSDVDANGLTDTITLAAGTNLTTVDIGLKQVATSSLGDRVWKDEDCDGIQDDCERGVAGIKVTLKGAGADNQFGTADDTTATTTTNSHGNYLFSNLAAGQYQVQFGALNAGYAYTTQNAFNNEYDSKDSDANSMGLTNTVTLGVGQHNSTVDAGIKCVPTGCIGDRVWLDKDADGIQDSKEYGVCGIKVTLNGAGWDGQFGTADDTCATTTTDRNGCYNFSGLAAGNYQLQFGALPVGYAYTTQNAGTNDNCDSDVNSAGLSHVVALGVGQCINNLDAGIKCVPLGSIGNRVWHDADKDGLQDSHESGVCGVKVTLKGAGTDGHFGTSDDITATTTTNSNGCYVFDDLAAGKYLIQVGSLPSGYQFTAQDKGSNDACDSDFNSSGLSQVITLAAGQDNLTVDAGIFKTAPISNNNDCDVKLPSLCDVLGVSNSLLECLFGSQVASNDACKPSVDLCNDFDASDLLRRLTALCA